MEYTGSIWVAMFFGGMVPGPLGLVAFVVVKFGGYVLAGLVLKRAYPLIAASAARIATVRTGLGLFLGLCLWALSMTVLRSWPFFPSSPYVSYGWLVALRIAVWATVIALFTSKVEAFRAGKFMGFAILGALWSSLLDVPGIALAIVAPGRIPIC